MKVLGVIGGLGPMATAYFLQLVTQMCDAVKDQEHIEVIVHSKPSIPDRTKFILGESSENPLFPMIDVGKKLRDHGAEILAIPCITAHYFHDDIEREVGVPVVNALEETAAYLKEYGIKKAGILATDGTVRCGLLQEKLAEAGVESVVPDPVGQSVIMEIIYGQLKSGREVDLERFLQVGKALHENGAEVNLLACTELSLIKRDHLLPPGYLDVLEVLARKAVACCGTVKAEYRELITT